MTACGKAPFLLQARRRSNRPSAARPASSHAGVPRLDSYYSDGRFESKADRMRSWLSASCRGRNSRLTRGVGSARHQLDKFLDRLRWSALQRRRRLRAECWSSERRLSPRDSRVSMKCRRVTDLWNVRSATGAMGLRVLRSVCGGSVKTQAGRHLDWRNSTEPGHLPTVKKPRPSNSPQRLCRLKPRTAQ